MVDIHMATCPECGAPLGRGDDASTDADIYPELARANLLRMRGEYKQAEKICLNILKQYPNNATSHTLLGDVYTDLGDLGHAAQWYELALDLNRDSAVDKQKLASVRERIKQREAVAAVEELGLPQPSPNMALLAVGAVFVLVVIGLTAYFLGQRYQTTVKNSLPISAPLSSTSGTSSPPPAGQGTGSDQQAGTPTTTEAGTQEDKTLTQMLAQRSPQGAHVMSVSQDPRSKILTITYSLRPEDDERKLGAELAKSALDQDADALIVTVRGVRDSHIAYVADVQRTRLAETQAPTWQEQNSGTADAWVSYVLTNEWTATKTNSENPGGTTAPGGSPGS